MGTIEMIEATTPSGMLSCSGPSSPGWFEPGALRLGPPSQDVTSALLFLSAFAFLLVLSVAILNYIGDRRGKQTASALALAEHTILRHAMITEFRSLAAGDSLGQAAQTAVPTLQSVFPVFEGKRPVGSLSRSALFSALERYGPEPPLRSVMETAAPQAEATETVSGALKRFRYTGGTVLWIVSNGALAGLVTAENLEEYLRLRAVMNRYSKSAADLFRSSERQNPKAGLLV